MLLELIPRDQSWPKVKLACRTHRPAGSNLVLEIGDSLLSAPDRRRTIRKHGCTRFSPVFLKRANLVGWLKALNLDVLFSHCFLFCSPRDYAGHIPITKLGDSSIGCGADVAHSPSGSLR